MGTRFLFYTRIYKPNSIW